MNILITGANGFVGNALYNHLKKHNTVAKLPYSAIITNQIQSYLSTNYKTTKEFDIMFIVGWGGTDEPDRSSIDKQLQNIYNIKTLINAIPFYSIKKIIFATSIAEFEFLLSIGSNKKMTPISLYGATKLYAHAIIRNYCEKMNINCAFAYLTGCFGPGDHSKKLIATTLSNIINNKKSWFSSGEQLYDFIYIDDIVKDLTDLMNWQYNGNYLLGSGKFRPLREILEQIFKIFNKNDDLHREFQQDIKNNGIFLKQFDFFSIEFISNITNRQRTPFHLAIDRTYQWLQHNKI